MFRLIKKIFTGLLTSIASASNYTKCVLLSNQECVVQPNLQKTESSKHKI